MHLLMYFISAWIQNGLMTVVGVGVMAYLQVPNPHSTQQMTLCVQTLEQMGGAT